MAHDFIPRPDGDFAAWASHYFAAVKKWWDEQGLDPAELDALHIALQKWQDAYPAHVAAAAAAHAARQAKDAARAALEQQVRPITRFVQAFARTTDTERANIGIAVRGGTLTPAPPPVSRPLVRIDTSQRLLHTLRVYDEATPTRRARPRGVERAEVFVALTAPGQPAPRDPREYRYIGSVTRGETTLRFEPDRGGLQAHYLSRWVSTRGATGPWSETASATVAA